VPRGRTAEEAVAEKLDDLCLNQGVWRAGLAEFLGDDLCSRLRLSVSSKDAAVKVDDPARLRAKVIWHLRRLIEMCAENRDVRNSAMIRLNITSRPELRQMMLGGRQAWAYRNGLCKSAKTVQTQTKALLPDLARALLANREFPSDEAIAEIMAEFDQAVEPAVAVQAQVAEELFEAGGNSNPVLAGVHLGSSGVSQRETPDRQNRTKLKVLVAILILLAGGSYAITFFSQNRLPGGVDAQTSGHNAMDNALRVTPLSLRTPNLYQVAFAKNAPNTEDFMSAESHTGSPPGDPFGNKELEAGAFALGWLALKVKLENITGSTMTVYNILPANVRREEVPLGPAILVGPAGGNNPLDQPKEVYLDLDEVPPVARDLWEKEPRQFFDVNEISLAPGAAQTIFVILETDRSAYSFDVEFHFEVGGNKGSQILNRKGSPFRVALNLCHSHKNPQLLNENYSAVRTNYPLPEVWEFDKLLNLHSVEPKHGCKTLYPNGPPE
jgi:hypothetical protein